MFRAIADPTRRQILSLLRQRRCSVGEIAGNFRVSRPAISKHIRLLRRAGLVLSESQGTARICRLKSAPFARSTIGCAIAATLAREPAQPQAPRRGGLMNSPSTIDAIVEEIAIKAPAERISDALTDPAARVKWWGLKGRFETADMESDLRPGRPLDDARHRNGRQAVQGRRHLSHCRTPARAGFHVAARLGSKKRLRRWCGSICRSTTASPPCA